ncbi:YWFCY domain-containing protein [Spirosoma endophyticum]|uniref:YWFCY domain-containing protein n=1 Tax=Spirosoma endophyticum TaxID=662367 RepID=A0A1I2BFN5_9BACT|nr:YWFCY domain-containing protein [Spirosoma endophyticum]SFE54698.1 hypothetical protein SAMN05216167_11583 [Spirosoma endophyticum]
MRKDLDQEYRSCLTSLLGIAYFLLILHFYKVGHPLFQSMAHQLSFVDGFMVSIDKTYYIFTHNWSIKLFILFLVLIRDFAYLRISNGPVTKNKVRKGLALCLLGHTIFFGSSWFLSFLPLVEACSFMLYVSLTTMGLVLIKRSMTILLPMLGNEDDRDSNDSSDWDGNPGGSTDPIKPRVRGTHQNPYAFTQ